MHVVSSLSEPCVFVCSYTWRCMTLDGCPLSIFCSRGTPLTSIIPLLRLSSTSQELSTDTMEVANLQNQIAVPEMFNPLEPSRAFQRQVCVVNSFPEPFIDV